MEGKGGSPRGGQSPGKERSRREVDFGTVPGGEGITALYSQLNSCISDLDLKVGTVLRQHEVDFLNVYKSHMFSIQKEMKLLKEKASEEANKRRRDEELVKLELERDWFRTEAVRLDSLCKEYKHSAEEWKAKAMALEEDRQFLQDQVILAKKVNARSMERIETLQQKSEFSPASRDFQPSTEGKSQVFVTRGGSPDLGSPNDTKESDEQRYKDTIAHLRNQLRVSQTTLKRIRAVKTDYMLERGELEDFFIACIEEVKKEIQVRRDRSAHLNRSKQSTVRPNEIQLRLFTESDKRKVIDLLLSQEQVMLFLHRSLFPEKRSQSVARIPEIAQKRPGNRQKAATPYPRHTLFRERQ